jgi:hypothetical protein
MKGGYSGPASFSIEIERFIDKETGELLTEEELPDVDSGEEFEYEHTFIELYVKGHAYYRPGVYCRRPEDCYPDESDLEIESITDEYDNDYLPILTKSELASVEEKILDYVRDSNKYEVYDNYGDY